MPKARYTGTQKKAIKQLAHEARKGAKYREEAPKIQQSYAPGHRKFKSTESKLYNTLKGLDKYGSGPGSPYKDLEGFLPGGVQYEGFYDPTKFKKLQHEQLGDIGKQYGRAYEYAQKGFDPMIQQAYQRFDRETAPAIASTYGSSAGAGSSALNQALAGARKDLELGLASQLAPMQSGIAQNILGQYLGGKERTQFGNLQSQQLAEQMNLGERARQQGLQYGAAADIFGAQRMADLGYGQTTRDIIQYMNQLGLGSAGQLSTAGLPGIGGALTDPYLQRGQRPDLAGPAIGGGLAAAGLIGAAALSSQEVKENIEDYKVGLEEVRKMKVKKYDYTIPIKGRRKGRIGLIAEEVPEEAKDKIQGMNAVDLYALIALLINSVQQMDKKIQVLEGK